MMPRAALALLLAPTLLAGCVEGEPRFFEDESADVVRLRVNAYQDTDARAAMVEVHGVGADNKSRAFKGTINVTLERQDRSTPEHAYHFVREYGFEVIADDFSTSTVPYYLVEIPAEELAARTTYRVWANATIGARNVTGEPALFAWTGA